MNADSPTLANTGENLGESCEEDGNGLFGVKTAESTITGCISTPNKNVKLQDRRLI